MSDADRVTIKAFDTTDEAKDAERLLLDHGLSKDVVTRKGKKLRVVVEREDEARAILNGAGSSGVVSSADEPLHAVVDGVQAVAGKVADATHSATTTVSDTIQGATTTVSDRVQDATTVIVDQVGAAADAVSDRVVELATTVREYGADTSGVQQRAAQKTANVLDRTAYYLRKGDVNIVLDDLRATIRQNPGRSLLLGLGLGYLARTTLSDAQASGESLDAATSDE